MQKFLTSFSNPIVWLLVGLAIKELVSLVRHGELLGIQVLSKQGDAAGADGLAMISDATAGMLAAIAAGKDPETAMQNAKAYLLTAYAQQKGRALKDVEGEIGFRVEEALRLRSGHPSLLATTPSGATVQMPSPGATSGMIDLQILIAFGTLGIGILAGIILLYRERIVCLLRGHVHPEDHVYVSGGYALRRRVISSLPARCTRCHRPFARILPAVALALLSVWMAIPARAATAPNSPLLDCAHLAALQPHPDAAALARALCGGSTTAHVQLSQPQFTALKALLAPSAPPSSAAVPDTSTPIPPSYEFSLLGSALRFPWGGHDTTQVAPGLGAQLSYDPPWRVTLPLLGDVPIVGIGGVLVGAGTPWSSTSSGSLAIGALLTICHAIGLAITVDLVSSGPDGISGLLPGRFGLPNVAGLLVYHTQLGSSGELSLAPSPNATSGTAPEATGGSAGASP